MFRLLSRIPLETRKTVSTGLSYAAVLALCFSLLFFTGTMIDTEEECTGYLWMKECETVAFDTTPYWIWGIALAALAVSFAVAALFLFTSQGRLKKYLPILKGVEKLNIRQIADITGNSSPTVYRDLETLIDSDMIEDLYIDYGRQQVVSKRYLPGSSHKTVVRCTNCQANNELIVGITKVCDYCRAPLLL